MMPPDAAALVAISHGTSSPLGQVAVAGLVAAVARTLPGVTVREGFVDVQQPDVPATLGDLGAEHPAVVVPLLLSAGYHVHVDLARDVAQWPAASLADALGPDRRLVDLLVCRLMEVGLRVSDRVVLACAGSSDARAVDDCERVGQMLAASLGLAVRVGFLSAASPSLAEAIESERADAPCSRIIASTYLLAPGYFAGLVIASSADLVAPPLLLPHTAPDPRMVDVVLDRYAEALAEAEWNLEESLPAVGLA